MLASLSTPFAGAWGPPVSYPVVETDAIPPSELGVRRARLLAQLPRGAVAILLTSPELNRNGDVDFPFRASSDMLYLSGCAEPDAALLLSPDGVTVDGRLVHEILFVNDRNLSEETWNGYRMGPLGATRILGVACALSNIRFAAVLSTLAGRRFYGEPPPVAPSGMLAKMVAAYQSFMTGRPPVRSLGALIGPMRAIKSTNELRLMRHALRASMEGQVAAIRACRPGMWEYQLKALDEFGQTNGGCESPAYPSIVGSGPNSCILHYEADRRQMRSGDIVCMDAAGEYHGYAADITRSFPVDGRYSPDQRAIYNLVLAAQNAGIARCRAGLPFDSAHQAAYETIGKGLVKLGIIGSPRETGRYFMHGTSHTVGLDVHDVPVRTLAPGVVLTVEPGIYIPAGSPCPRKWWNIGIRIEDDVLVTAGDPVILSADLPRKAADIEAIMRR